MTRNLSAGRARSGRPAARPAPPSTRPTWHGELLGLFPWVCLAVVVGAVVSTVLAVFLVLVLLWAVWKITTALLKAGPRR